MSTERPIDKKAFKRKLNRQLKKTEARKIKLENYLRILNQPYPDESDDFYDSMSSDDSMSGCNFEQMFTEESEQEVGVADDAQSSDSANVINVSEEEELEDENVKEISDSDSEFNEFRHNNSHEDEDRSDYDDDDNDVLAFADDHERGLYVLETIRQWALEGGSLSMIKLDALLARLHPAFPEMPLSYKTLLATPKHLDVIELENNTQMWYKSIRANLDSMNLREYLQRFNKITIDMNVDGLPLSKSSKQKFWPILGKLVGSKNEPFIIAVLHGNSDPKTDEFLMDFVLEIQDLSENGYIYDGQVYQFVVRHYICDAPARALMKGIVEHGGYCACEKCTVIGEWIQNRMIYLELDQPLRTDESFTNREQLSHHRAESLLEVIPTGMVSQFRLDVLHLVHFGVFKRLLLAWMKWNGPWKLHHTAVDAITNALKFIESSCPSDFNRKPREFNLAYYKATEFRRILLYDGIVIFKDNVLNNVYKHFLLLHCGLYILSSPVLVQSHLAYADELLKLFITHSAVIFGDKFVVYNVHSLCHLVKECIEHGNVESFSAYPFENKLKSIKSLLQSGYKPLHQVAYRDHERNHNVEIVLEDNNHIQLSMKHFLPEDNIQGSQFRCVSVNGVVLKVNKRDFCFRTKAGEVVSLQNIILQGRQVILVGFLFQNHADVYEYPLRSSLLGIVKVSNLEERRVFFHLEQVEAKCWLIPDGNSYFVVFKFLNPEDSDNEFYDVGLAQWLETEIDANMKTKIKWPSDSKVAGDFVRKEKQAHLSWSSSDILVKRFYDTYINAAQACKQYLCDSNYESCKEMGRGHRIKRKSNRLDSSSEEEKNQANHVKCGSNSKILSPPCLKLSITSGSSKRENLKRNTSSTIEIVDSKKAKKANNILQHLRRSNGPSGLSIQNEFLETLKNKSEGEIRTVVEPKILKESSQMKQKEVIQSTLVTEALQQETLKDNCEKKLKKATQTFVSSHSDTTEIRPSTPFNKERQIDVNSAALSTDIAQYISLKNNYNMEESPKSDLWSPSATNANLSSSSTFCHSVSNSSHEGNTEILDIVEENISENSNMSQISNRAMERFDVESQVSLSSLRKEMREVSSKLDIVIMNQEQLNRFVMPTEKVVKRPSKLPPLPLKTERELAEMEQFLSEENNLSATCAYMSRYVNLEKVKTSTFRILRNVVTNSLAKQFSFQGSGTKKAFRSLKLYSVVEGAFVSKEEKFNLTLVESATSLWLVNAAWRKQEDGSSQRSSKSHKHRKSPSPSLFQQKSHIRRKIKPSLSLKESHRSKGNSMLSHSSSKSQRLEGDSKLSHHSPKKCHRSPKRNLDQAHSF